MLLELLAHHQVRELHPALEQPQLLAAVDILLVIQVGHLISHFLLVVVLAAVVARRIQLLVLLDNLGLVLLVEIELQVQPLAAAALEQLELTAVLVVKVAQEKTFQHFLVKALELLLRVVAVVVQRVQEVLVQLVV
jgi:hypothetical protein